MRSTWNGALGAFALLLGACSRGSGGSGGDGLPDDLKRDLAAATTSSDLAPAMGAGPRTQFVSSIERTPGSTPARSPKVARHTVPPTHHHPVRRAPTRKSAPAPVSVASADQPAAEPASEPAPVPSSSGGGGGRGGQGGGGILGGILGAVLGGGGYGGHGHHGHHGHHGDGDGDGDGDRRGGGGGGGGIGWP
jgi:hypothetical protein